jgi:hypothetical protein
MGYEFELFIANRRHYVVGSWGRVGELGHGQVTVRGLKAVMIHGRN